MERSIGERPEKAAGLYTLARSIDPARAYRLAAEASAEEERNFWTFVGDMNLQRAQAAAIEKNLF